MFKKKDQLIEVIKKENTFHLMQYLDIEDIAKLSLASKRYYLQLSPYLTAFRLDQEGHQETVKTKYKQKKIKAKVEAITPADQKEV